MKLNILPIIILGFILCSCSEEFTETIEIGTYNTQSFQTKDGIDFLLTGAYSALDGITGVSGGWESSGDNWWMDVVSDDAHKGSNDGEISGVYLLELHQYRSGNSYLNSKWRALYAAVNRANAVIAQIAIIPNGSERFKKQLAEAIFLRGHFNFQLQIMWGKYAVYIDEQDFADISFNKPNGNDLWSEIDNDFLFAMNNLPKSQIDFGRVTSWSAKSYLAKSKLYQKNFDEALLLFDEVIQSGPYSLMPEFCDNFRLAGEDGSEAVFIIQFDTAGPFSPNGNQGGTLNFQGPNDWCCGFFQPSVDLVNSFQTKNGLPLLDTYHNSDVKNDFGLLSSEPFTMHEGPLDPRIDYTIGRRGIDYNSWGVHPGKDWVRAGFSDISGPYTSKKNVYWKGEDTLQGTGNWGQQHSGINYYFIRYADVLLMGAESAVETGDLEKARNYLNQVRKRAKEMTCVTTEGGDALAANYQINLYESFPDQDYARKAVRMERRLELGMEGHRLFDLRRWGIYVETMNRYVLNETRTIKSFGPKMSDPLPKHNLFPIPISAIDQSKGLLEQNPDWE